MWQSSKGTIRLLLTLWICLAITVHQSMTALRYSVVSAYSGLDLSAIEELFHFVLLVGPSLRIYNVLRGDLLFLRNWSAIHEASGSAERTHIATGPIFDFGTRIRIVGLDHFGIQLLILYRSRRRDHVISIIWLEKPKLIHQLLLQFELLRVDFKRWKNATVPGLDCLLSSVI